MVIDPAVFRPVLRRSAARAAKPRVLGLDCSLSSTGYAYVDVAGNVRTGHITTGELRGPHRLFYIRTRIESVMALAQPNLVVIEDYAMGQGGRRGGKALNNNVFKLGELGGVLRVLVWDKGADILLVAPSSLKSIIAHDGHAKKPEIAEALYGRFGISVQQNDEADAAGLLVIGEMKLGLRDPEPRSGKTDRFQSVRDSCTIRGRPQSLTPRLSQS